MFEIIVKPKGGSQGLDPAIMEKFYSERVFVNILEENNQMLLMWSGQTGLTLM